MVTLRYELYKRLPVIGIKRSERLCMAALEAFYHELLENIN